MNSNEIDTKKGILLYIIPSKIQKLRLQSIKNCAIKNGYKISETLSENVTHVLTELESEDLALKQIIDLKHDRNIEILSLKWFFDSVKSHKPQITESYKLKRKLSDSEVIPSKIIKRNQYLCQRPTLLSHENVDLVKALEIMAKEAELRDDPGDYPRALAFRKACSALKQSKRINHSGDITKIHDIGQHSARIITEIIEHGHCDEVEKTANSNWFKSVTDLTSIFGVGPSTAKKWFIQGYDTLEKVKNTPKLWKSNLRIVYGLAFHSDLNSPMTLKEGQNMKTLVQNLLPNNCLVEITGGFRRGKPEGHDLDLLITSPDEGKEAGILEDLYSKLKTKGIILYGGIEKQTNASSSKLGLSSPRNTIDNFDKCFTILKYQEEYPENDITSQSVEDYVSYKDIENLAQSTQRLWKAKRVDLVICPYSQWAFALLGWTGNKMFNRSLRDYASKEMNMKLSSHGLYNISKQENLNAQNEKDIFSLLNLNYLEPWERNA